MKKSIFTLFVLGLMALPMVAQNSWDPSEGALLDGKTIVKAGILGLPMRNFSFSAERILTKQLSVNLGVSFMPKGGIPMANTIKQLAGDSTGYINDLKINSFSLTPELRIYMGAGYGKGFYFAPYYKFYSLGIGDFSTDVDISGKPETIKLDGGIKTHSGGLLIGYQWMLGKKNNIVLDWTILGVHYGASNGELNGKTTYTMTPEEQNNVKKAIDENIPSISKFKFEYTVNANSVKVTEKGPWAFVRTSLSVGYRF